MQALSPRVAQKSHARNHPEACSPPAAEHPAPAAGLRTPELSPRSWHTPPLPSIHPPHPEYSSRFPELSTDHGGGALPEPSESGKRRRRAGACCFLLLRGGGSGVPPRCGGCCRDAYGSNSSRWSRSRSMDLRSMTRVSLSRFRYRMVWRMPVSSPLSRSKWRVMHSVNSRLRSPPWLTR